MWLIHWWHNYWQVHVRGGSIIPGKGAGLTTVESRQTNSTLLVALDDDGNASGDLYIDDGESIKPTQWNFLTFNATNKGSNGQVISQITDKAGDPLQVPPLDTIKVLGIGGSPTKAYYNGEAIQGFSFNTTSQVLLLTNINVDLTSSFKITWEWWLPYHSVCTNLDYWVWVWLNLWKWSSTHNYE